MEREGEAFASVDQEKIRLSDALLSINFLIVLLTVNVLVFGDASLDGSNQIILIISAAFSASLGVYKGISWSQIMSGITKAITVAVPSLLILLMVGALSGAWMVSGIVPAAIYYGLKLLSPEIFFPAACVICAIVSLATGSSWTTAATIGVALIAIAKTLGLSEHMAAGAILSGAYFGDKLSPLSDTTNLAPAVAGTDLFTHIRYMLYTTVPSIALALLLFAFFGSNVPSTYENSIADVSVALQETFDFHLLLLVPPLLVGILIMRKIAPLPVLFFGTMSAIIVALLIQPELVSNLAPVKDNAFKTFFSGALLTLYGDINISTNNALANELLSTGGMAGMLGTVWLIVCAMIYGGVMESTGMLKVLSTKLISFIRSKTGLIASTSFSCVAFNAVASDQYLSIIIPGRIYSKIYKDKKLAPENLSRTLEDAGTVTSVLVPWNTCGAYHANILGVATLNYLPYCFFNLISPVMTILISAIGYKIKTITTSK